MNSAQITADEHVTNLHDTEAIDKLQELVEKADTGFFCTNLCSGGAFSVRPMSAQKVDEQGNLWFLSDKDSKKNHEIETDPKVQLLFNSSSHDGFISVYGRAEISQDKAKIKELWQPLHKTWFQGGEDDPNISVIKLIPEDGYYWDTKHGKAIAFLKMVASTISGKTMDDSIEGRLEP